MFAAGDDKLLRQARALRPVAWWLRWDVLPFAVAYGACFSLLLLWEDDSGQAVWLKGVAFISLPIFLALQMLLFLVAQSSVALQCALGYVQVSRLAEATHVHAVAAENAGKDRIVPLLVKSEIDPQVLVPGPKAFRLLGQEYDVQTSFFEFQKVTFTFDEASKRVSRLEYLTATAAAQFLAHGGLDNPGILRSAFKWGWNEFDIPLPEFLDLYVEHLVAPFFVFQVLCLVLWSLDDYWYYSVFTLVMLMFFEGMQCRQRQYSLQLLRNMRRASVPIFAFRNQKWGIFESNTLVPGDVVSLAVGVKFVSKNSNSNNGSDGGGGEEDNVLPCDALLIGGSCVVNEAILTGESVPQIKESIARADGGGLQGVVDISDGHIAAAGWRRHLLLGGTKLVQHEAEQEAAGAGAGAGGGGGLGMPPPPNQGCVAVVVRTGFGTEQGSLMRKILFATERVNANSAEAFYFILVLVFFAAIASAVVLAEGLQDATRNKFKLFLHCIMIVTSVVPPELPMELSLAVTNSLGALTQHFIFCTEPFRIPFAGKLDVLCFDKTGTLTKDEMILRGLVGCAFAPRGLGEAGAAAASAEGEAGSEALVDVLRWAAGESPPAEQCPDVVLCVLAACNSLHRGLAGDIIGDPLEVASYSASGFAASGAGGRGGGGGGDRDIGFKHLSHGARGLSLALRHRFPFNSTLKRMSVVVDIAAAGASPPYSSSSSFSSSSSSSRAQQTWVLAKGAPEVLEARLESVPSFYRRTYQHHMRAGRRVLVLAGKPCSLSDAEIRTTTRDAVETGLRFLSFVVFDSDLKADSKSVVKDLRLSMHKVIMITGDSAYTASDVGRKLGLLKKAAERPLLFLQPVSGARGEPLAVWRREDCDDMDASQPGPSDVTFKASAVKSLGSEGSGGSSLCVTGPALDILAKTSSSLADYRAALAALAPAVTLFARMSPAQKEEVVHALNATGSFTLMCGDGTNDVGALKAAHVGVSIINDPKFESMVEQSASVNKGKGNSARNRAARAMKELEKQDEDPTIVKLGDASIASPFTARRTSIDSVLTVIRQGRCTLVTTIQVFKILALNCLVSAYMMSALYLQGLKQGDMQMTATGLISAVLFFFLSQTKPLTRLDPSKPPSSAFAPSIVASIAGQFFVHLASLMAVMHLCQQHISRDDATLTRDGKFQPNVINSAMFLLSVVMQINNFVINYRGHPFTQSIQDNMALWRSVQGMYVLLLVVAGGQFDPINDLLQMAPFPSANFQGALLAVLAGNFALAWTVEFLSRKLE